MKKITANFAGNFTMLLTIIFGVMAFAQLISALVAPDKIAEMFRNMAVNYYAGISDFKAFWNEVNWEIYEPKYIRMMSMFIFTLNIPIVYGLFNVHLICKNGESDKPFRASTKSGFVSMAIAAAAEIVLDVIVFIILKLVLKKIPFYIWYVVIAVAALSLVVLAVCLTIIALINKMSFLREEHKLARAEKKSKDEEQIKLHNEAVKSYTDLYDEIAPPEK